jgi:hypothetical protein
MQPDDPISLRVHETYPNNIVSKQQKSNVALHIALRHVQTSTDQITNKSCLDVTESN